MGRDDNRAMPGLQGGRAPARAFQDFMSRAVANRPVENFDIQVQPPDWQQEPDDEVWFGGPGPDNGQMVDENGDPLPQQPADAPPPVRVPQGEEEPIDRGERLDQEWIDRTIGRDRGASRVEIVGERRQPPPRRSGRRDPVEPGAEPPEP